MAKSANLQEIIKASSILMRRARDIRVYDDGD